MASSSSAAGTWPAVAPSASTTSSTRSCAASSPSRASTSPSTAARTAARPPHLRPILFHEPVEHFAEGDTDLRELHLYEGNFCNRTCAWCTINGSPQGWYERYSPAVLDQALATLAPDGNLKFYGGEPT